MSKKRCFICNDALGMLKASCITKDGYLICGKDANRLDPKRPANTYRVPIKLSNFISSHTASEIESLLGISSIVPYKEHPDLYKSKLSKVTEKLDSIADSAGKKADTLQAAIDEINKDEQEKSDVIKQQLKDANVENLFGTKKEIKALPDIIDIDGGEKILYAANAFIETHSILAVCTNKRVIFLDHGLIYGSKSTDIPLDMINGVSYSKGLMLGSISVTNGAITTQIENMQPYPAKKMAEIIKQAAADFKQTSVQSNSSNDLSQLRELKQLLDDGVITEEEFTAKKKQILEI